MIDRHHLDFGVGIDGGAHQFLDLEVPHGGAAEENPPSGGSGLLQFHIGEITDGQIADFQGIAGAHNRQTSGHGHAGPRVHPFQADLLAFVRSAHHHFPLRLQGQSRSTGGAAVSQTSQTAGGDFQIPCRKNFHPVPIGLKIQSLKHRAPRTRSQGQAFGVIPQTPGEGGGKKTAARFVIPNGKIFQAVKRRRQRARGDIEESDRPGGWISVVHRGVGVIPVDGPESQQSVVKGRIGQPLPHGRPTLSHRPLIGVGHDGVFTGARLEKEVSLERLENLGGKKVMRLSRVKLDGLRGILEDSAKISCRLQGGVGKELGGAGGHPGRLALEIEKDVEGSLLFRAHGRGSAEQARGIGGLHHRIGYGTGGEGDGFRDYAGGGGQAEGNGGLHPAGGIHLGIRQIRPQNFKLGDSGRHQDRFRHDQPGHVDRQCSDPRPFGGAAERQRQGVQGIAHHHRPLRSTRGKNGIRGDSPGQSGGGLSDDPQRSPCNRCERNRWRIYGGWSRRGLGIGNISPASGSRAGRRVDIQIVSRWGLSSGALLPAVHDPHVLFIDPRRPDEHVTVFFDRHHLQLQPLKLAFLDRSLLHLNGLLDFLHRGQFRFEFTDQGSGLHNFFHIHLENLDGLRLGRRLGRPGLRFRPRGRSAGVCLLRRLNGGRPHRGGLPGTNLLHNRSAAAGGHGHLQGSASLQHDEHHPARSIAAGQESGARDGPGHTATIHHRSALPRRSVHQNRTLLQLDQTLLGLERKLGVGPHPRDRGVGKGQFRHGGRRRGDLGFLLNFLADLGGGRSRTRVVLHHVFDGGDLGFLKLCRRKGKRGANPKQKKC